jgi:hypothetical protein
MPRPQHLLAVTTAAVGLFFLASHTGSSAEASSKTKQLASACVEAPTPKCLLADAQVAAMLIKDNRAALSALAFVQEAQSLTGDRAAALDSLRVGELRVLGAGPEILANYHAAVADVWAVLKDEAKAKAAIDAALQHVSAAEDYDRGIALADIAYAQTLIGDKAGAASNNARVIEEARQLRTGTDVFLLAYVGWNQIFAGDRKAGLSTTREALAALDAPENATDDWIVPWVLGYASVGQSLAKDAAGGATRDRLQQAVAKPGTFDVPVEIQFMLAWSQAISGERSQAEATMRDHLRDAYDAADNSAKVVALCFAALALAPEAMVAP